MPGRLGVLAALVVLAASSAASSSPPADGRTAALQHVTLFGDSVAEALPDYDPARKILTDGVDVEFEVEPCRRVGQLSCPFNGVRPPNVIDVVSKQGAKLGPTVIVAVGYNDFEDEYAHNIADALDAMKKAGIKRVLWVTLRAARHSYLTMNDAIVSAAATHPSMLVVDWNLYSRSHPEWFQQDGIHLGPDGAVAMATLLHTTLLDLGIGGAPKAPPPTRPVRVTTARLPAATKGKSYAAKLAATGGRPPYFWSLPRRLPKALRLRSTGWLSGIPRRPGTFRVDVRVRDAAGTAATRRLSLRVRS
jgi:hypothetical protein